MATIGTKAADLIVIDVLQVDALPLGVQSLDLLVFHCCSGVGVSGPLAAALIVWISDSTRLVCLMEDVSLQSIPQQVVFFS
jgi:hypothetical protein